MTKAELVKEVALKAHLTQPQADAAITAVAETLVANVLKGGASVSIPGLGTFKQVETAARMGRNPKTGEAVSIAASTKMTFKMSSTLK